MKQLLTSLLILLSFTGICQFPNQPTQGNASTNNKFAGAVTATKGAVIGIYSDTTQANLASYVSGTPFIQITTADGSRWVRNATATQWLSPLPSSACQGLIFGGFVTLASFMDLNVTNANYCINGINYNSPSTVVTLAPADPDNPRKDVIYADTLGHVGVLTGTPATNPIQPQVDPFSQVFLATVDIPAGASSPSGLTRLVIYNENVEWATSSTLLAGSVNYNDVSFPYIGVKDAATADTTTGVLKFASPDTVTIGNYDVFQLFITLKAAYPVAANIQVGFTFGGAVIGNMITLSNTYGFQKNVISTYQNVSIPIPVFQIPSTQIDGLQIKMTGNAGGVYIDYIQLQSGIIPPSTNFDGRYWKLFQDDTTYSKHKIFDSLFLSKPQSSSDATHAFPSPPLRFSSFAADTVAAINRATNVDLFQGGVPGAAIPSYGFHIKLTTAGIENVFSSDGSINWQNSINFLSGAVISASNRSLKIQTRVTNAPQLIVENAVGAMAANTEFVLIKSGSSNYSGAGANTLTVVANGGDSILLARAVGNIGIGSGSYNPYAQLMTRSLGKVVVFDTMNTAKRDGIINNITGTAISNGGSGMTVRAPRVTATNVIGGIPAALVPIMSGGVVIGITINNGGSSYPLIGGSLVFDTTGCTVGTGNVLPIGTYTAAAGTLPLGGMFFNTDSTCYQSWNGSSWDNMRQGSAGIGAQTWQQTLTTGSTLTTDNNVDQGGHLFSLSGGDINLFSGIGHDATFGTQSASAAQIGMTALWSTGHVIVGDYSSGNSQIDFDVINNVMTFNAATYNIRNLDSAANPQNIIWRDNNGDAHLGAYPTTGSTYYNSNIGAGFRQAVPNTNNIKTWFAGYGFLIDSSSNTNGLTGTIDTTALKLIMSRLISDSLPTSTLTAIGTLIVTNNHLKDSSVAGGIKYFDPATGLGTATANATLDASGNMTLAGDLNMSPSGGSWTAGGFISVGSSVSAPVVNTATIQNGTSNININISGAGILGLGDPINAVNGTKILIDDNTQTITTKGDILIDPITTASQLYSNTYTPTVTNGTNTTSSTGGLTLYTRVGNNVHCEGYFTTTTTAAIFSTVLVSLPIASTLGSADDLSGSGGSRLGAGVVATSDTAGQAIVSFTSLSALGSPVVHFSFDYIIN